MNFCVVVREIREINKRWGGQNKLRGALKNHGKYKLPPLFIFNLRVETIKVFTKTQLKQPKPSIFVFLSAYCQVWVS